MKAKLDAGEFKRIINNTKLFVDTDAGPSLMQWIYLEINADKKIIRATALEGHCISIEYAKLTYADESFTCFIKPEIPRISKRDNGVELEVNDNLLYVRVGNSIMGYVQPEGQYYPVDDLIKDYLKNEKMATVGVNANFLKNAMKSISTDSNNKKIAKIDIYNPKAPVIIRSGKKGEQENLKIVLPVNFNDCEVS